MNYSAINIQGNIVSSEILEKIRTEDIRFQKSVDFGLAPSSQVRDEINLAWNLAVSHWNAFKIKRELLKETDTGTAETRRYWMLPLLQVLGYEVMNSNAEIINGKTYAISHRASNRDGFPLHIVGVNQSLDKRAEIGGTRLSPHALAQEYLNNTEHTYGLISNGRFIRVLRDATRLSKLSYLEFDLEQILEEGLYVEFALMYRVLHASRMPEKQDSGAECFLEFYHQEALASGSRIRERLSVAVEKSIKELANGFLRNPGNHELHTGITERQISSKEYYLYTLRLVYRILFLLVIEERKLIYPEKRGEELDAKRAIYYKFYSIQRLTKLAEKLIYVDPRKTDLWQSLITTFALFEEEQYAKKLGISPLGSGIFTPDALGILGSQFIDNETLLRVLRYLVTFENEHGQRVRVNYADLDVEEFGSVYEGLLDYDPEITTTAGQPLFGFVKGDDRSSSGSHYTPEELVRPLIKHSLDYLIEDKLKEADPEKGLLSLTICDVACGSGHILLSAARRVGFELAKVRSKEDQPTPSVLRTAVRDVIRNCIYGVDLNPLAVELCKVALWLEAHEPGSPLNFLDHHIKCGNAIVGLAHAQELEKGIASEAFKTLPGDDKEVASSFKKRNDQEVKLASQLSTFELGKVDNELKDVQSDFQKFTSLPENTPEQIAKKEKAYQELTNGKKWWRLKNLADLQVAQFFIPKTYANKEKLTTHSQYKTYLQGTQILDRGASMAISQEKRFFHWFLEFPEVFQKGGFDCILGNPPYLGGGKISSYYGHDLLSYLIAENVNSGGQADLIVYFLRRYFEIIANQGSLGIITTNSICEAETRIAGLSYLIENGGHINFAIKKIVWPGEANITVSLLCYSKASRPKQSKYLNGKNVSSINSLLNEGTEEIEPFILTQNLEQIYMGVKFLGDGFLLEKEFAHDIIKREERYKDVVFPLVNGRDINENPLQNNSRYIINFFDWSLNQAQKYPIVFERVQKLVKPIRDNDKRESRKSKWWIYAERSPSLFNKLISTETCLVTAVTSKFLNFSIVKSDSVFTEALFVIPEWSYDKLAILSSVLHDEWSRKYGSTLGLTLRYGAKTCYNSFPFIDIVKPLEFFFNLYDLRTAFMKNNDLGLTDLYNIIHSKKYVTPEIQTIRNLIELNDKEILEAYGWGDVQLRHDFYEVDYLPENDRVRYTIHPEARKEVLKRLLQLNHDRYAEEVAAGLHDKKTDKSKTSAKKGTKKKKGADEQEELFY